MNKRFLLLAAGFIYSLLLVLGLVLALAPTIHATPQATITVDTTDDEVNSDGDCSLREALIAANTDTTQDNCGAGSGPDTIVLPSGTYTLTIAGTGEDMAITGDLDINDDLTLTGAGAASTIIDGGGLDRVFDIGPFLLASINVDISGITIQNGDTPLDGGGINKGSMVTMTVSNTIISDNSAIYGGGIANNGMLTVSNTIISDNSANYGGGIANDGMLTVDNSTLSGNTVFGEGGGLWNTSGTATLIDSTVSDNTANIGGGIYNEGMTTLDNTTVFSNTVFGEGGGINNTFFGTATLTNSTLSDNTANNGGGINNEGMTTLDNTTVISNTVFGEGGGIWNFGGTVTVTNSIVSDNTAGGQGGGGISNNGMLTVDNSTLSDNTAGRAGGIYNSDTLTITNSTVSGNIVSGFGINHGGGIYNSGGVATLGLTNSTVSDNTAGDDGGGIYNDFFGAATLTNSTLRDNTAIGFGGGIYNDFFATGSTATLKNTIVGNSLSGGDCSGFITSDGHNLDSDGTCALAGTGDLTNTDPRLGSLADNGGPTHTHALLARSPAIDAGDDATCPETDQRGELRPVDGDEDGIATCDIGAFEFNFSALYLPVILK